jgi:type IV pilus assembly protein PilM
LETNIINDIMLFSSKSKSQLGIDIGTSNIKIVQLREESSGFVLETYGMVNYSYQIATKDGSTQISKTAELLKMLMSKAHVTTNQIVASLPNSSVFTSVIEMPPMSEQELKSAVEFEAKKYIPLPLDEVALSWSVIIENAKIKNGQNPDLNTGMKSEDHKIKILLTAVPKVVVENYMQVFRIAGLQPLALEIEALSLIRSVVGNDLHNDLLIDIGAKTTSINFVENGFLRLSKSLNIGGDTVTSNISQTLSVNFSRAEQFKKDFGLSGDTNQVLQVIKPIVDAIKTETQQLINLFESKGDFVQQIFLSGGGSKLPSIKDFFSGLGKPVILADPWSKIIYPQNLKPILTQIGSNLSVAVGLAMRKK